MNTQLTTTEKVTATRRNINETGNIIPVGMYAPYYAYPAIMTEDELAHFLRIAELSDSNPSNVIANLKRMRGLPRIRISHGVLYPLDAIREWVKDETITE